MSIATEITRLQNAKSALKSAIENKGVTVPSSTKLDGYASLVNSVPGIVPEGTINITENGENIDVKQYARANVNVQSEPEPLKMMGWSYDTAGTPVELWPNIANYISYTPQNDTYTFDFNVQYNRAMTEEEASTEIAKFTLSGTSVKPTIHALSGDEANWLKILIEEVPGGEVRSESVKLNYDGDLVDTLFPLYNQIINVAAVVNTPQNDKRLFFTINYQGIRTSSQLRPRILNTYIENDEVAINIQAELDSNHSFNLRSFILGFDESLPLDTHTCTLTNIGNNIYSIQGTVPKATGDINSTTHPNGFKFYINGIEVGTAIW